MIKEHDINQISQWISDYFSAAGKTNAIIGISGGIDSAVTASLCVRALGKDRILGAIISINSTETDKQDALTLIKELEIDHVDISLEQPVDEWFSNFMGTGSLKYYQETGALKGDLQMVLANAKARFRMMTLYSLSEMADGLVVGTTNKSEADIGYLTKYGDGGVDIEPLIEFYKTEIYDIAKLLDIPQEIINKKPSAGLWAGQTDEDEIGLPYSEIDRILQYLEGDRGAIRVGTSIEPNIDKVRLMVERNRHKGAMPPHYRR